ncbi:MAG: hypothetical protein KKA32_09930 [Actinobacteria bacterium]|nr:hypothetical protein [Actinomycetota bacterium]
MNATTTRAEPQTREYLERTAVFTTAEFRGALGPGTKASTVNNRLLQAYRRGYVERVTRGVYVSRLGVFRERVPDPLVVASKLAADVVIAYHSALEAHGVAHSPFTRVTYLTSGTPARVTYRGHEFAGLRPPPRQLREGTWRTSVEQTRRGRDLLWATSRERTLVDCLDRLQWSGGPEELFRSLGGFPTLNIEPVVQYLDMLRSPAVTARVAWVLFARPGLWLLTESDRGRFRGMLGRGPYFFGPRRSATRFVPEWSLYVPRHLDPAEFLTA